MRLLKALEQIGYHATFGGYRITFEIYSRDGHHLISDMFPEQGENPIVDYAEALRYAIQTAKQPWAHNIKIITNDGQPYYEVVLKRK